MRILIATAGELPPEPVADLVARISEGTVEVFVATVVEVPRSFIDEIRSEGWHPMGDGPQSEAEEVIARWVEERGSRITDPVLSALRNRNIAAKTLYLEGEDPADTLIGAGQEIEADLLVVGTTKRLFDESHWASVTSRIIRDAGRPVLVVPPAPRDDTGEIDLVGFGPP